jgi:Tfp pilus assembly protein PilF
MIIKDAGSQHPMTAQCLNNLATILMDQQRFDEAESLFRKALAIQQQALGADHPMTKETQANLVHIL